MEEKPNLVLITIDCLRQDLSGFNNNSNQKHNFVKNFIKKGAMFTQAISNGPNTPSSFPSLFTSVYPFIFPDETLHTFPLETIYPIRLGKQRIVLAEILRESGYFTIGIQDSNPFLSSYFGYNRGFDILEDMLFEDNTKGNDSFWQNKFSLGFIKNTIRKIGQNNEKFRRFGWAAQCLFGVRQYKGVKYITNRALSNIGKKFPGKSPFFLWLHLMDAHMAYSFPRKYIKKLKWFLTVLKNINTEWQNLSKNEIKLLQELYELAIHHIYNNLDNFVNALWKLGINKENTYFVLTADHGEEFLEHGEITHPSKLFDVHIRVPLVIAGRGITQKVIDIPVGLMDVAPTILDLLGIDIPKEFMGVSLKPYIDGSGRIAEETDPVLSMCMTKKNKLRISARTKESKCIAEIINGEIVYNEFYNLREDPGEVNPLSNCFEKNTLINSITQFLERKRIGRSNKEILH